MIRRARGEAQVVLGEQRDRLAGELRVRLPKGRLDPGETPEAAALREVAEETGLAARVVAPLGSVAYRYRDAGGPVEKRVHFFLMEAEDCEPAPPDGEFQRVFWCRLAEAAQRLSFDTEREVLARARERLAAP